MTATYGNSPSTSNIDAVRFLTKDTSTGSAINSDEEIQWLIDTYPSIYLAAAAAADAIAGSYADQASSKKVGDLSISYGGRAVEYTALAKSLRMQAALKATPFSGGISISDKDSQEADSDWDRPSFSRGMSDNYGSTGGLDDY